MRRITIMSGCPGSGKSTYARDLVHNNGRMLCSRDALRNLIRAETKSTEYFPVSAEVETDRWFTYLRAALIHDGGIHDVVIDQTTIGFGALEKILRGIANHINPTDNIDLVVMKTPLAMCIERNRGRKGFENVPESNIGGMFKRSNMEKLTPENVRIIANEFGLADRVTVKEVPQ